MKQPTQLSGLENASLKLRRSWVFKFIVQFLKQKEVVRLQLLDRYFYEVQIPRLLAKCKVKLEKTRLHFLNQDYIILFDLLDFTKRKLKVGAEDEMWPLQA